jgi:hypothetical protein
MTQLIVCAGCNRHVRCDATTCPFCAVALPGAAAPRPLEASRGMSRAAILALGAAIATSAPLGCSDETDDQTAANGSGASGSGASGSGASGSGASGSGASGSGASGGGGSGTGGDGTGGTAGGAGGDDVGGMGGIGGQGGTGNIAPPYGAPPQQ